MSKPKSDKAAIRQTIRALKRAGYSLPVIFDGEDWVKPDTEAEAIEEIMAVDAATLYVELPTDDIARWVYFVMGNDPE